MESTIFNKSRFEVRHRWLIAGGQAKLTIYDSGTLEKVSEQRSDLTCLATMVICG
jgi:hypothetical protein